MGFHRWKMWTRLGKFVPCPLVFCASLNMGEALLSILLKSCCGFEPVQIDCFDC